jgi:hypothetical protein
MNQINNKYHQSNKLKISKKKGLQSGNARIHSKKNNNISTNNKNNLPWWLEWINSLPSNNRRSGWGNNSNNGWGNNSNNGWSNNSNNGWSNNSNNGWGNNDRSYNNGYNNGYNDYNRNSGTTYTISFGDD